MPHGQQAAVLKNESHFSAVKQGLGSAYSLLSWGTSSALKIGYSAYQYTKGILRYEQTQIQCEETKAKQELSSAEYALAETISHTLKEIAVSVILSSGASWPTIAYVTWGMLPKNTVIKLGTAVFGSHFPTVIDVQHIAGNTLTVMNGFFPTSWLQLGCKKGMDRAVNFIGSEQLSQVYQDYHMGERIWLWTGVAVNAQRDLKIVAPEVIQTEVLEYRHQDVVGTVTDTRHCRSKWLFWQECHVKERRITEHDLSTHAIRNGILRSREDGELLEPVSYSEDSDARNYSASYEDDHLVREVSVPQLPKPSRNIAEVIQGVKTFSVELTGTAFFLALVVLSKQIKTSFTLSSSSGLSKYSASIAFAMICQLQLVGAEKGQRSQNFNSPFSLGTKLNSFAGKDPRSDTIEPCRIPSPSPFSAQRDSKNHEDSSVKTLSNLAGRIDDIEQRTLSGDGRLFPNTDSSVKGNGAMFAISFLNWRAENTALALKYASDLRNAEIQSFENEFGKIPSYIVAADNPLPAWYLQNQYMMQKIAEKYGHLMGSASAQNRATSTSMSIEVKNLERFSLSGSKNKDSTKYNLGLPGGYSSEPSGPQYSLGISNQPTSSFEKASGAPDEIFEPVYEMVSQVSWWAKPEVKKAESSSSNSQSGQFSETKSGSSDSRISWTGPSSFEDKSRTSNRC